MDRISLELAEECIQRVKTKAAEMGICLSIAVVDDTGNLVAYARMGNRRIGLGEKTAIAKARTAAAYKKDTKQVLESFADRPANYRIVGLSALYPDDFWAGPGGAPITIDGETLGGLGVSGSSPQNDHKCVTEALQGAEQWGKALSPS
jgi:uncharacterized protein GlcG (DUF336 family)